MKMTKIIALVLALVLALSLAACTETNPNNGSNPNGDNTSLPAGTYDIKVWVSEIEGVKEKFEAQIDAFEAANPGIVINASIEGVSEANAAGQVLNDPATAPDIYCFAQDQLARLVQAAALAPLGNAATETVTANNKGKLPRVDNI